MSASNQTGDRSKRRRTVERIAPGFVLTAVF
jgi:hypothetical protein